MPRTKSLSPGRTEAQVLAQVIEAAAMLGLDLDRQNTGAAVNPSGRLVTFGRRGNSDLSGQFPDGRKLAVEVKREGFDPRKLRGEKRAHFDRQLERLRRTNASRGVAFFVDDVADFITIIRHVLAGARVVEPGYGPPEVIYPNAGENKGLSRDVYDGT